MLYKTSPHAPSFTCVPTTNTDQNRAKGPRKAVVKPTGSSKTTKEVAVEPKSETHQANAGGLLCQTGRSQKRARAKHLSLKAAAVKSGRNKDFQLARIAVW